MQYLMYFCRFMYMVWNLVSYFAFYRKCNKDCGNSKIQRLNFMYIENAMYIGFTTKYTKGHK